MSQEAIEKNRQANIGKKHSKEQNERQSQACKINGTGKWMKGKKRSQKSIEKQIESKIKNGTNKLSQQTKEKIGKANSGENNGMYGKHHTKETKEIISKAAKLMWKNKNIRESIINHPNQIEGRNKGRITAHRNIFLNGKKTAPEMLMENILNELNIKYEPQFIIKNILHSYPCDFYIPSFNLIIEVDGKYWHNYPNLTALDKIRNEEIVNAGYKLLRFWEDEITLDNIKNKLFII